MATKQESSKDNNAADSQDEKNDPSCPKLPLRFIRLHPRFSAKETLSILQTDDGVPWVRPVPWSLSSFTDPITQPSFYAIPGYISLQQTSVYQSGRIYGQDVSSGCSVAVLLEDLYLNNHTSGSDLRILDLCTCPGLKLCAIADCLHHYYQHSCSARHHRQVTLIGVDVDADRLHVCKRILQKYQTPPVSPNLRIQLYCGDGTTFLCRNNNNDGHHHQQQHVLVYDSHVAQQVLPHAGQKRINKSGRRRGQLLLQSIQREEEQQQERGDDNLRLFDYVLVDAECSTDGSLGHERNGSSISEPPPTPPALIDLQRRLLQRGLNLLRPGSGRLVYATCSLRDEQNDGVVEHVLTTAAAVSIVPVHRHNGAPDHWVRPGRLPGTVQLWPNTTDPDSLCGSGLYVAKLRKDESNREKGKELGN